MADFSKFAATFQRDLNTALRGVRLDMSGISDQISNGVRDGVNAANQEFRRLGTQAGETFNTIAQRSATAGRSMAASFSSAGREMSNVGDQMTMAISLPVAVAGAATLNAAGNFEKAMNRVKAATEASGKEFADLRALAIDLGSTTAFSASEAAYAMNELATAGFDTAEIMGALPGVLDMAAAGSVSLADAAEIASGILNGFGFAATDLSYVNDVLARDFLSTATNLSDLGESFKYVGPTAKSAGLTFTEVAAAIGLMGNAGIKGSMAGTALNSSIARLLKPTAEVETTIKALGITVTNSSGKLLPLVDIMRQLEKSGADTADMIALFGLEAGPDMMALLSQGSGALANLDKELKNAGGTAQKVATTQMQGFNGSLDELTSAAEGLMIAIGDAGLLGWMTSLTKRLTDLTAKLATVDPVFLRIATVVGAVVIAIGPLLAVFGRMATAIGEGIIALKKFGSWAVKVAPWLTTLAGPIGLAIAALLALAVAAVVAYKKSEAFRQVVDRAFRAIATAALWMWQNGIVPAFNWIVAKAQVVGAAIARLWQQAQPVFIAWGAAVMRIWNTAIKPAFLSIGNSFRAAGSAIAGFWAGTAQPALTSLMALLSRVAVSIRSWWSGNGDTVMRTAGSVMTWLGGVALQVWSGIMTVLKAVAAVITWVIVTVAIPLWKALVSTISTIVGVVMSMRNVWTVVGVVIGAAVMVVVAVVKVLWAVLTTAFSAIAAVVRWLWTSVVVPAFQVMGVVVEAFVGVVTWMWSVMQPVFQAIGVAMNAVGAVVIWLWTSVIMPAFRAIGAVISWVWTSVIMPVFNALRAAVMAVGAVFAWWWNTFSPVFRAVGNLMWTVWSGIISVVFDLIKLAFSVIWGVIQVWWAGAKTVLGAFGAVFIWLWGVISPVFAAIGSAFMWLWSVIQVAIMAVGVTFTWLWGVISPVFAAIGSALSWLWGVIVSIFNAIVAFIKAAIIQIVAAASGVAAFVSSLAGYFQAGVNAVRDKIGAMISFVRELPGKIISAIGNVGSMLYNAGQNVINGLIDGIASRIGALRAKIADAARAIRDALPFSPAKYGPLSGGGAPDIAGATVVNMITTGMKGRVPALRAASIDLASAISSPLMMEAKTPTLGAQTPMVESRQILSMAETRPAGAPEGGRTYTITVNAIDPRSAARGVIEAIAEWERTNGSGWRARL